MLPKWKKGRLVECSLPKHVMQGLPSNNPLPYVKQYNLTRELASHTPGFSVATKPSLYTCCK